MSLSLATFYRWAVVRPFSAFRQRADAGPERSPAHEQEPEHDPDAARRDDPERLERIAIYARAGYFNMGYTADMFHMIGEIGPE
ncbi:MAG TPA: hypothetical protein VEI25_05290 [Paraburkholderia sp.]|nr:hypothetical protein [Paraburkholderia sp.]